MTLARRRHEPTSSIDLYGNAALADPDGTYRQIRDSGPAVWLPRNRMWAIGRYADVKRALRDDDTFRSGRGVAANPLANRLSDNTVLNSDDEDHKRRRKVMLQYLAPRAISDIGERITERAVEVVDALVGRGEFDAVADFASALPVGVVADLVGLRVGHDALLRWASGTFQSLGPLNRRMLRALPAGAGLVLAGKRLTRDAVVPGSWAAGVFDAADRGDISRAEAKAMIIDFVAPSLDTTILSSAYMLALLGRSPQLWTRLRDDSALVNAMVAESVRLSSPIRGFTRFVAADTEVDGQPIAAGSRVVLLYAAANRDERQFPDPDEVDLTRRANEQLGWGHGPHACVGMHLAKLEMTALLEAMRTRVAAITVAGPGTELRHNTLQGYTSLPVRFG